MKLTERRPEGNTSTDLEPTKILCLGKNYEEHAQEMGGTVPHEPMLFLKPPSCLIEEGGVVQLPSSSRVIHHEVELALIVGERAHHVSRQDWEKCVYGYAIFIDITARDLQAEAKRLGKPWTVSKGFDTFGPVSPITPKDQAGDPHKLNISLKKNGVLKQDSNTSRMIFNIPVILEYASKIMTLEPGDIISTGTPEGVGEIQDGDRLEAAIDDLGSLSVSVRRR